MTTKPINLAYVFPTKEGSKVDLSGYVGKELYNSMPELPAGHRYTAFGKCDTDGLKLWMSVTTDQGVTQEVWGTMPLGLLTSTNSQRTPYCGEPSEGLELEGYKALATWVKTKKGQDALTIFAAPAHATELKLTKALAHA